MIRKAVLSDAHAVATVHVRSWQHAYKGLVPDSVLDDLSIEQRRSMWERAIPSSDVWVALADDEIVGFATVGPSREPDAANELYAIYLLPSAWGTGLARPLAEAALGDKQDVALWVFRDNPRARRFYERLGFVADGQEKTETMGSAELAEVRYRRAVAVQPSR